MSVSVWVAPGASVTGVKLPAVRPLGSVAASVTVSGTLPTFCSVSVAVAGAPGVLLSDVGELVSETAVDIGDGERLGLRLGDRRNRSCWSP